MRLCGALEILHTNFYLKPEKCLFTQLKVKYLGLILSQGQVTMDPVKVSGIQDWPIPHNVTEVKFFLGFINFYWWFIKDFSHCQTSKSTHKGECIMVLDTRWARTISIWWIKTTHHINTDPCASWSDKMFSTWDRYICICHRCHSIPTLWWWEVETSWICV